MQTSTQRSSALGGDLQVGEFVEYEHKAWRVGLVNFTRARLDPVTRPANVKEGDFAGSVNVGPASTLRRLSEEEAANYGKTKPKESDMAEAVAVETGAVAGVPVPTKANRVKAAPAKKAAAAAPTRKATGSAKTAAPKRASKPAAVADKPCKCGCGGKTASNFIAGHDARFKGWLLAIERGKIKKEDVLKKAVISAYTWKKKGNGEIPTTDYKGQKHTGYESTSEA